MAETKPLTPKKLPNKNKAKLKAKLLPNPISKDMPRVIETKPLTPKKLPMELQKMMKDMGIDINQIDLSRVKMQDGGTKRQTREAISKRYFELNPISKLS